MWIEDCSECVLNEVLQEEFKGSGGKTSKASVKISLIYEIKQRNIHSVELVDRRSPDQTLAKKHCEIIQKGDLVIRDLARISHQPFGSPEHLFHHLPSEPSLGKVHEPYLRDGLRHLAKQNVQLCTSVGEKCGLVG